VGFDEKRSSKYWGIYIGVLLTITEAILTLYLVVGLLIFSAMIFNSVFKMGWGYQSEDIFIALGFIIIGYFSRKVVQYFGKLRKHSPNNFGKSVG
jgi:hypothetical protein